MNISKTWIWILIVVVVLALAWFAWQFGFFSQSITNEVGSFLDNDTTAAIDKDLNTIDVDDPDQDLKQLDADLNQL